MLCAVMDARAGQVYHANFDLSGEAPARLCADRAVTVAQLREELAALGRPILLAGDGAHLLADAGERLPENLRLQNAYGVARLAARVYVDGGDFFPRRRCVRSTGACRRRSVRDWQNWERNDGYEGNYRCGIPRGTC